MAVILIVEDDALMCELVEMLIQGWGYHTLSANDKDEALSLLRSSQSIDALFTDIYLKTEVLGGCELVRQAITLRPKLRVLYTTGNSLTNELRAQFVEGTNCLSKPYSQRQLQKSLEDLLAA